MRGTWLALDKNLVGAEGHRRDRERQLASAARVDCKMANRDEPTISGGGNGVDGAKRSKEYPKPTSGGVGHHANRSASWTTVPGAAAATSKTRDNEATAAAANASQAAAPLNRTSKRNTGSGYDLKQHLLGEVGSVDL